MTQPEFVPTQRRSVRPVEELPVPESWVPDRPAELPGRQPVGKRFGVQGPDQGYALKLASTLEPRIKLQPGERMADAKLGCVHVATKRAAIFGRAPVIHDLELAFALWGFFEGAPADLIAYRKPLFTAIDHHYADQRTVVDQVPEATLRMTPEDVKAQLGNWRSLLNVPN